MGTTLKRTFSAGIVASGMALGAAGLVCGALAPATAAAQVDPFCIAACDGGTVNIVGNNVALGLGLGGTSVIKQGSGETINNQCFVCGKLSGGTKYEKPSL